MTQRCLTRKATGVIHWTARGFPTKNWNCIMSPQKAKRSASRSSAPMFELKITLLDIRPLIWRRLRVGGGMNLGVVHSVLQGAIGWQNSHMHPFVIGEGRDTDPHLKSERGSEAGGDAHA